MAGTTRPPTSFSKVKLSLYSVLNLVYHVLVTMKHDNCGGELVKNRIGSWWYRCKRCDAQMRLGGHGGGVRHNATGSGRAYYAIPYGKEGEISYPGEVNGRSTGEHMSLNGILSDGGKILVVGSRMNPSWASFKNDPRVVFWCGEVKDIQQHLRNGDNFPANTKGVIISRFIGHSQAGTIIAEARRKRALIMNSLNDGEVTAKLEEILGISKPAATPPPVLVSSAPPEPAPAKPVALRKFPYSGRNKFVARHDNVEETPAEAGRRIHELAVKLGWESTEMKMAAAVRHHRTKLGIKPSVKKEEPTPAPIAPPPPEAQMQWAATAPVQQTSEQKKVVDDVNALLHMIDEAVTLMGLIKEKVTEFRKDSDKLDAMRKKLQELANF